MPPQQQLRELDQGDVHLLANRRQDRVPMRLDPLRAQVAAAPPSATPAPSGPQSRRLRQTARQPHSETGHRQRLQLPGLEGPATVSLPFHAGLHPSQQGESDQARVGEELSTRIGRIGL